MTLNTDPKYYNLHSRTKLAAVSGHELAIVKRVKSRIISKDALKIIEQVDQIKSIDPSLIVSLICTPNICSKSLKIFEEKGVKVYFSPIE